MQVGEDLKRHILAAKDSLIRVTSPQNYISDDDEVKRQKSALAELRAWQTQALKSGAVASLDQSQQYIVQKDPHNTLSKSQFEDSARADGMVSRGLERKADFVFAKGFRCVLELNYDNYIEGEEEKRKAALSTITTNQEYKKAKETIDKVNRRCNFRFFTRAGYINEKIYGRSAILKDQTDPVDGLPSSLYMMASRLLGNVYCDSKTKKIAYIEYNSDQTSQLNVKSYYEPKELIYFTNRDYNISAGTYGYGLSEIEGIKDISETNRFINEAAEKETIRSLFAGYLILKFPSLNNQAEIQNILNNIEPGRPLAVTTELIIEVLKIASELNNIIEAKNENDKAILRNLGMPTPAVGFENITNRATVAYILSQFKETFIEQERIALRDILNRDWLEPMWGKILNLTPEQVQDLDARVNLEFIEYSFDTLPMKVESWLPLYDAGVITNVDLLEKLGEKELANKLKEEKNVIRTLGNQFDKFSTGFGNKKGIGGITKKESGDDKEGDEGRLEESQDKAGES